MKNPAALSRLLEWRNPLGAYRAWRYKQYAKHSKLYTFSPEVLHKGGYYSQCGQDYWLIENVFAGFRHGVFVDIGAHDGISFSNTFYLEKHLGWGGLAIEPMPDVFERLDRNRDCVKVNGCVSAKGGEARFRKITGYSEMLSGLVDNYDPRHLQRIEQELEIHGGVMEEIAVTCYRLNPLLTEHGLRAVDYLNIDVEGAEYDILRSIDFNAVDIKVCGIENNYRDYRIPKLMKANGFEFVAIVGDEFYVKVGLRRSRAIPALDAPTSHREMP